MGYDLRTQRGYDFYEVASALQKSIRRGDVKTGGIHGAGALPEVRGILLESGSLLPLYFIQ